ncbi:hypothetical protein ANN_04052 [Periplaneta americana]|uniref:Uncharacterized protein n=1 Tax=Periplaneta americana TaxID=6978 RepID=A0ABQ8T7I8_PERAM|nr:hypothetical protein ANN_04052 [Periplaneta americana]
MCYDLLEPVQNENLMDILFSDEATFHVCGKVHRHNSRIWTYEQPHETSEWERGKPKGNSAFCRIDNTIDGPDALFRDNVVTIGKPETWIQFCEFRVKTKMKRSRRACVNSLDSFCYVCGEFTAKSQRRPLSAGIFPISVVLSHGFERDVQLVRPDRALSNEAIVNPSYCPYIQV